MLACAAAPERLLRNPVFLMAQIVRLARRRAATGHEAVHRLPRYAVLAVLAEFGPCSQRGVSDRLRIDPSDLVDVIDAIERDGHLVRERDPRDRRRYTVRITPAGRRALRATDERSRDWQQKFFEPLSTAELETLRDLLARLYAHHSCCDDHRAAGTVGDQQGTMTR